MDQEGPERDISAIWKTERAAASARPAAGPPSLSVAPPLRVYFIALGKMLGII